MCTNAVALTCVRIGKMKHSRNTLVVARACMAAAGAIVCEKHAATAAVISDSALSEAAWLLCRVNLTRPASSLRHTTTKMSSPLEMHYVSMAIMPPADRNFPKSQVATCRGDRPVECVG